MADIELVIKISEVLKKDFESEQWTALSCMEMKDALMNATPLPKGHGRIGDLDKVADRLEALRDSWDYYGNEYESGIYTGCDYSLDEVMDASTIIVADTKEA